MQQTNNISDISYSPSTFLLKNNPNKYGDNQEEYITRSKEAIAEAVGRIRRTVAEGGDLTRLFFDILDEFCKKRSEIAENAEKMQKVQQHASNSDSVKQFGRRRDIAGEYPIQLTPLIKSYAAYGTRLLMFFRKKLIEMEQDQNGQMTKVWSTQCGSVKSSLEMEILKPSDLQSRHWLAAAQYPNYFPKLNPGTVPSEQEKQLGRDAYKRLQEEDPVLYQRIIMSQILAKQDQMFPSPNKVAGADKGNLKDSYLLATARMEFGGKMYVTSQYLTWLFNDKVTKPHDRMLMHSKVLVIHQDRLLIPETLNEIAEIFKRAVLAKDPDTFAQELRHFQHLFANNMCVERGCAALNDWYTVAMAEARECAVEFDPSGMVDLLALTSPLYTEEYVQKHGECVSIKPKSVNQ